MPIANTYNISTESAIASYNYTDLDSGTGYVVYYGLKGTDGYLTSKSSVYSNVIISEAHADGNVAWTKELDIDFDIYFNYPKTIKGLLFATFTQCLDVNTAGKVGQVYTIVKVRKWDGTTETEIANNQSDTYSRTGTGAWVASSKTECVEVEIPQTHFKRGEYLRLTFEVWVINDAATDAYVGLAHDPRDRDEDSTEVTHTLLENGDTSVLEVHVPFRIDL